MKLRRSEHHGPKVYDTEACASSAAPLPHAPRPTPHAPRRHAHCRGAVMIEGVLVLPLILFILSLVIYFGFAMKRFERATMMDRYEAWRSSARAPGPSLDLSDRTTAPQLADTFFRGDTPTQLTYDGTLFFPAEPGQAWERAADNVLIGAGDLLDRYSQDLPRGRSIRFYSQHQSAVPLWEKLFAGSIVHRHTVMDTQWRFVNNVIDGERWYDDVNKRWANLDQMTDTNASVALVSPGDSIRETFYSDFDRRIENAARNNPLGESIQNFYLLYPPYKGPKVDLIWEPGKGWY